MPEDTRSTRAKSAGTNDGPAGPGDEDWDKAQAVLEGRVDPTAPDKTADDVAPNPRSDDKDR